MKVGQPTCDFFLMIVGDVEAYYADANSNGDKI